MDDSSRVEDSPKIKVTDRRLFTSDGELREDVDESDGDRDEERERAAPRPSATAASSVPTGSAPPRTGGGDRAAREVEREPTPAPAGRAADASATSVPAFDREVAVDPRGRVSFLDLVGMLAEPIALYLGDLAMPNGERTVDLDQARVYIDLLGVLQEKTRGNLSAEEEAVLSDLLYRLKMRYVQKRETG